MPTFDPLLSVKYINKKVELIISLGLITDCDVSNWKGGKKKILEKIRKRTCSFSCMAVRGKEVNEEHFLRSPGTQPGRAVLRLALHYCVVSPTNPIYTLADITQERSVKSWGSEAMTSRRGKSPE